MNNGINFIKKKSLTFFSFLLFFLINKKHALNLSVYLKEVIILKINFSKTYDSINWQCLFHVMECLNMGLKWGKWI